MRLHRFFIEDHLRNKKDIDIFDDELIHQWKDVFRLRAGDRIILLDNTGFEYLSEVSLISKGKASIKVIETTAVAYIPKQEVWLYASLIKKDNYEWILEKCTELGVTHFVPVISDRSEKKDLNVERSYKILKEAAEQSGKGKIPELHEVVSLEMACNAAVNPLVFHLDGQKLDQLSVEHSKTLSLFIGPEGGWSPKEILLFQSKDMPIYKLGSQVLRAETAAIAITTLFLF